MHLNTAQNGYGKLPGERHYYHADLSGKSAEIVTLSFFIYLFVVFLSYPLLLSSHSPTAINVVEWPIPSKSRISCMNSSSE